MAIQVLVPRLGEGVEEVTVTKWLKQPGEFVNELEPLLEINTDKVDTEVPSPASGVLLQIIVREGALARVGEVLAMLGETGESAPTPQTPAPAQNTAHAPAASAAPSPGKLSRDLGFISPVVSRMAAQHNLDLTLVKGTGLHGRITKDDVLAYLENKPAQPPQPTRTTATPGETLIPLTPMRQQIARHLLDSKNSAPQVLTVMEADLSGVVAHRAANKENFAHEGTKLTFTPYFMMATVAALKACPLVNATWTEKGILQYSAIHLGMATSLGMDGLIVPVIKNADGLSLLGMARAVNDLASRARARKLTPDEVRGGTFTLTNHGTGGSLFGMPIINQSQCGILGIGTIQKRAVVITDSLGRDSIAIRPMVYLSFVFDHRILDGTSADLFVTRVKEALEKWQETQP